MSEVVPIFDCHHRISGDPETNDVQANLDSRCCGNDDGAT